VTAPENRSKPTEEDVLNKPEDHKNLDRDGGERQPTDQSDAKEQSGRRPASDTYSSRA